MQSDPPPNDPELVAGALRGEPARLVELASRLELVPRLLQAWNERCEPALRDDELQDLSAKASVTLWQDMPQYAGGESLDDWLTRHCATLMDVGPSELGPEGGGKDVLARALAMDSSVGDIPAKDALARFRANQSLREQDAPTGPSRPIWAVLGILGVIGVFLATSPYSPLRKPDPAPDSTAVVSQFEPIRLTSPLSASETVERWEWQAPAGLECTLLIEDSEGVELLTAEGITGGSYEGTIDLKLGVIRWRVMATDSASPVQPSPWSVIAVGLPETGSGE